MRKLPLLLFGIIVAINIAVLSYIYSSGNNSLDESVEGIQLTSLIPQPFTLSGRKEFALEKVSVAPSALEGATNLQIVYDLHGLCVLEGKSGELFFEDSSGVRYSANFSHFGRNCMNGEQTADIPLSQFKGLPSAKNITSFGASIWYPTEYQVTIMSAGVYNSDAGNTLGVSTKRIRRLRVTKTPTRTRTPTRTPTPVIFSTPTPTSTPAPTPILPTIGPTKTPTPSPTGAPATQQSWSIQSVSSMKETKDRVCNQRDSAFIQAWVDAAKELGANYVAVETPYDNPSCGDAVTYTRLWVDVIRSRGLRVWHRHMPLAFEGIYNVTKNPSFDYLQLISDYIKAHPDIFAPDDIFTPIPEPQNGGIAGITYCAQGICVFNGAVHFNQWLRDAMTVSDLSFQSIGLGGKLKIGYFGFDGFVAWGDNNPDWTGILEDATVAKMGNITIDHYPEAVGDTMQNDLNELETRYPGVPIIIGEWGTITGGTTEQQVRDTMGAAKRPSVIGFNYWHMGTGGNEALINSDFSKNVQFDDVQGFFRSTQ